MIDQIINEPFMMGVITGASAMALVWMFFSRQNSKSLVKKAEEEDGKESPALDPADWWKRG